MRVDSVSAKADRMGRHQVKFSDDSVMKLYRQTIEDFGLFSGLELSDDEFKNLQQSAGQMSAKMRAVRIVAASNVSKRDLQQRLVRKGESPEQAQQAVQWMEELSLVDDEETARQIVHRCIAKGYGISRAKQALYEKRIPKELWDAALDAYPDQQDKIRTFLVSRIGSGADEKEIKKAVDALIRRGHSYSSIRSVLTELLDNSDSFLEDDS